MSKAIRKHSALVLLLRSFHKAVIVNTIGSGKVGRRSFVLRVLLCSYSVSKMVLSCSEVRATEKEMFVRGSVSEQRTL